MEREIRKRKKRAFVWILVVALLCNHLVPMRVQAVEYNNKEGDSAQITDGQILVAGDTIVADAQTSGVLMVDYFDWGDEGSVLDSIEVTSDEPHKVVGYTGTALPQDRFGCWMVSNVYTTGGYVASVTLTAVKICMITYELDGGSIDSNENPSTYLPGVDIIKFADAVKAGHTFEGWYSDENFENKVESISGTETGDVILYAKFTPNTYAIKYELDGGKNAVENPSGYTYGIGVEKLGEAEKEGHTFDGWYSDADFTKQVTSISSETKEDITLYAKFTPNIYAIKYELDGGINVEVNPEYYTYGTGVEVLGEAVKAGYTFEGWYSDENFENKVTLISGTETGDIILYAKFTPNTYAIKYELDGGTNAVENPSGYTYGIGVETLGEAEKEGYTFDGWYSDADFMKQVTSISSEKKEDITLYAKFTVNSYAIKYELDGGTNADSNPEKYTFGVGIKSFAPASKEGYIFEGWYDALTHKKIDCIDINQTGDITLYVKWTAIEDDSEIVIKESGIVSLKAGNAYTLGDGFWKIQGDDTVYTGGITFYVANDAEFEFIKR